MRESGDACTLRPVGIALSPSRSRPERAVHAKGSINWINVLTIVSVAVLVGTELVGAAGAAGWAIGGGSHQHVPTASPPLDMSGMEHDGQCSIRGLS